jgi:hypothetical protein
MEEVWFPNQMVQNIGHFFLDISDPVPCSVCLDTVVEVAEDSEAHTEQNHLRKISQLNG